MSALVTSDGRPTNAVYGFAVMLQALRQKEKPEYLAVAFDVGKPTFRHRRYEDYKVHRKPMPEELIEQVPLIKRLLSAYRVSTFEREGFEGEDILATLARILVKRGIHVYLVTGDKDALQLVSDRIKVYNPHKGAGVILDAKAVEARYGVAPEQMVDLMALMGDSTDHIPGVLGIGEKTAAKLLQEFGSLDALYRGLGKVSSQTQRRRLEAGKESALLSRELAKIDDSVPIQMQPDDLLVQEPDRKALRALFRELQFKRLLKDLELTHADSGPGKIEVEWVREETVLKKRLSLTQKAPTAVVLLPVLSQSMGSMVLIFADSRDSAWFVRLDASSLKQPIGKFLVAWLEDSKSKKCVADLKGLHRMLRRIAVVPGGFEADVGIAAYLLNPARTNASLSDLADEHLDVELPPAPALDGLLDLDDETLQQALGQQACTVFGLQERLNPALSERQLESLYRDIELPLAELLAEMETTGITVDTDCLKQLKHKLQARLSALTEALYELAGGTFNLNSPKQLSSILFEKLGLPVIKRGKTGPSTDAGVLQELSGKHPLPARLIEYRELSKLMSTYVETLPKLVNPRTGRIHTNWNQTATATGRLSSSDPNLQNIPIKTETGRQIRKAFVAGPQGGSLIAIDYSQIELRVLAHLSEDEALLKAFREGHDIHRYTASLIYGIPEEEVQPEQRSAMKAVNFGIIYGMSAFGLARELGIGQDEAQSFIGAYFERYPGVRAYQESQIERAKREGCVKTLLGRRRYIPELNSRDVAVRQFGQRLAVNAPIQGSAADLMKRAMLDVREAMRRKKLKSSMLLQVHDELLFESPQGETEALIALAKPLMEGVFKLCVPLVVKVQSGPNWLDLNLVE